MSQNQSLYLSDDEASLLDGQSVELATLQWVHWFNHTRLLEPIG